MRSALAEPGTSRNTEYRLTQGLKTVPPRRPGSLHKGTNPLIKWIVPTAQSKRCEYQLKDREVRAVPLNSWSEYSEGIKRGDDRKRKARPKACAEVPSARTTMF
jgi:hypothetical protein